jgi:hypothetical protein
MGSPERPSSRQNSVRVGATEAEGGQTHLPLPVQMVTTKNMRNYKYDDIIIYVNLCMITVYDNIYMIYIYIYIIQYIKL